MTIKEALNPKVLQWFYNHDKKVDESVSSEDTLKSFALWYSKHKDELNTNGLVNEGMFSDAWDDEDDDGEKSKPEPADDPIDDEDVDEDPTDEMVDDAVIKVDNIEDDNEGHNVFEVVNDLYDQICEDGQNLARKTPLVLLDTSHVTDMTALLAFTDLPNADLSTWDTSRVKKMEGMFYKSTFNNDSICEWKVIRCVNFKNMFRSSRFNQSLSHWTPGEIEVEEVVKDPVSGETRREKVKKRVNLPVVGAYEDEAKEIRKRKMKTRTGSFKYESKLNNIMDFESFMVNEGFLKNFGKKVVNKVKNAFKSVALKVNKYLVSFIGEDGLAAPAVSPYTTLNYISDGKVKGVRAFTSADCALLNDNVEKTPNIQFEEGYYEDWKTGGREYKNLEYFLGKIQESEEHSGNVLNEDRVGFSSESGGIHGIEDVNSEELLTEIDQVLRRTPGDVGDKNADPALLIWGAPGVGKSTIPKAIIRSYNKNAEKDGLGKKAIIVAECGDMTPDGFSLPMPVHSDMYSEIEDSESLKELASSLGLSDKDLKAEKILRSNEAPKTWLPCFKPNPNDDRMNELNMAIANGYMVSKYIDVLDKEGKKTGKKKFSVEKTTDGGLLMFDEFFRADESIFKILMQILLNRRYGDFMIGDKWAIIACTNRPNDDDEVRRTFGKTGAVVTTRVTQVNFIPDFMEWKKWALDEGGFDEVTLEFLTKEKDPETGEYSNWHNIDPSKHKSGEVTHATPRTWSMFMTKVRSAMELNGYDSIFDVPEKRLKIFGSGTIGKEMTEKYIDYLNQAKDSAVKVSEIFKNPKYDVDVPTAEELSESITRYVDSRYKEDELPSPEEMVCLFKFLDRKYSSAKDNIIKEIHHNMFVRLQNIRKKDVEQFKKYREYIKLCESRHEL